jgi:phage-related protein
MKEVIFVAGSKRRLKSFPDEARTDAGHQLWLVQQGRDPDDWRPMQTIGTGAREIRIHKPHEHRVIYVARFEECVYVLHAFEKKTRQTAQHDIEIARVAYAEVKSRHQQKK